MKPFILVLCCVLSMAALFHSCSGANDPQIQVIQATELRPKYLNYTIEQGTVRIYELDGCEYVRFDDAQFSWGGHKGNCKNPIHNKNQAKTTEILGF